MHIAVFNERSRVLHQWTRDRNAVLHSTEGVTPGGGTSLFRAVSDAVQELRNAQNRRNPLVVSDGNDNEAYRSLQSSSIKPEDFRMYQIMRTGENLRRSEAAVYAIGIGTMTGAPVHTANLRALTDPTGGYLEEVKTYEDVEVAVNHIGDDLRAQYILAFEPEHTSDASFHRITVKVQDSRYRVRTRAGFVAAGK